MKDWFSLLLDPHVWLTKRKIAVFINCVNVMLHVLARHFWLWRSHLGSVFDEKGLLLDQWSHIYCPRGQKQIYNWKIQTPLIGVTVLWLVDSFFLSILKGNENDCTFPHSCPISKLFPLKDLLKDVNSFVILQVFIFYQNLIELFRDLPGSI